MFFFSSHSLNVLLEHGYFFGPIAISSFHMFLLSCYDVRCKIIIIIITLVCRSVFVVI